MGNQVGLPFQATLGCGKPARINIDRQAGLMYTEITSEVLSFRRNKTSEDPSGLSEVFVLPAKQIISAPPPLMRGCIWYI